MSTEEKGNINNEENIEKQESNELVDANLTNENEDKESSLDETGDFHKILHLSGMYKDWFLDYASYVILERAVPHVYDGLKPVQRRILHSMKKLDDGRYNKVANIIGNTMQYHPHGDASIGDALVQLGQKDLLIDMQGNWGNILTGDRAAAARYIEARLSKFAIDVVFNPKTTFWKLSYDGRNNEPIALPVKFPLLLTQGVEGIAVGLASKILPHNFNELIDASINCLKDKAFEILPDFPTGGFADVSKYNDGLRGGRVRVRAKIERVDTKTLSITELPFGKTTGSLIESILKANEKGKIKVKKIDDNTAEFVEILIHLAAGISPDKTIDALFAFTDCEISISPNSCIIDEDKPKFLPVKEILRISAYNTVNLLKRELEIRKGELEDSWHLSSLEKIFIENRIYHNIEECETWEAIIETIDEGLEPFKKLLQREVTEDDIVRLTEIKIKRISKYNAFKAEEYIKSIEAEIKEINHTLENLIPYAIDYYKEIKRKYGKGKERKTELRNFDTIQVAKVVEANEKLYVNYKEGFVGTSLKKDEFISDCSDIDDIIVFLKNGVCKIVKADDKVFVGKNIIHVAVFKRGDERTVYNMVYQDGKSGNAMMKRFAVTGITRDKEYDLTKGSADSKVLYFTANPNGEAEKVKVILKPKPKLKKLNLELDFSTLAIKGRGSIGNILTKNGVHKIKLSEEGESTLGRYKIWFDEDINRLNEDERGLFLGKFHNSDKILIVSKEGYFRLSSYDLSNRFEDDIEIIEKYNAEKIFSVVYFDAEQNFYYLKRFSIEESKNQLDFIGENPENKLICISGDKSPGVKIKFGGKHKSREDEIINVAEFIGEKSYKARGKRLSNYQIKSVVLLDPVVAEEEPKDSNTESNGSASNKISTPQPAPKADDSAEKEVKLEKIEKTVEAKEIAKEKTPEKIDEPKEKKESEKKEKKKPEGKQADNNDISFEVENKKEPKKDEEKKDDENPPDDSSQMSLGF